MIRHVELGVAVGEEVRAQAREWLETEALDWDTDRTRRELRRRIEIERLTR